MRPKLASAKVRRSLTVERKAPPAAIAPNSVNPTAVPVSA